MPAICINTDQYRVVAFIFLLQGGDVFERMRRYNAIIMIGSCYQGCRVCDAFFDVM